MTKQQQELVLATKKLHLTKERTFKHYLDPLLMFGLSMFFLFLIRKGFIKKDGDYDSPYFLVFLIFPAIAFLLYYSQKRLLQLKQIDTRFAKQDNYKIVKETLKTLGWDIKVDSEGFIEAYTNNSGFWTWTDQMISIIIIDNTVLFNSVGNVDTYATQAISWGQHSRNRKQFRDTFELIAINQSN